jgi:hypothetical protein
MGAAMIAARISASSAASLDWPPESEAATAAAHTAIPAAETAARLQKRRMEGSLLVLSFNVPTKLGKKESLNPVGEQLPLHAWYVSGEYPTANTCAQRPNGELATGHSCTCDLPHLSQDRTGELGISERTARTVTP